MARHSYLSRVAGSAPAPSLQLIAGPDVASAQPAALSSLLQQLSPPAATPQPHAAASPSLTMAAIPTDTSLSRGAAVPRVGAPPEIDPIKIHKAAGASVAPTAEPARFQSPNRAGAEAPAIIESGPKTLAEVSPGPSLNNRPAPQPQLRNTAEAVQPQREQPARVHVHIGTVEVRTKAPPINAAPPAPAATAAATFPAPPRGYGWGYGLGQR